jgi:hypothetical protein
MGSLHNLRLDWKVATDNGVAVVFAVYLFHFDFSLVKMIVRKPVRELFLQLEALVRAKRVIVNLLHYVFSLAQLSEDFKCCAAFCTKFCIGFVHFAAGSALGLCFDSHSLNDWLIVGSFTQQFKHNGMLFW